MTNKKCSIPQCGSVAIPQVPGVGISSIVDNENGTMTITLTSGFSYIISLPNGPTGPAGVSITSVSVDEETELYVSLIFVFSDGTEQTIQINRWGYVLSEMQQNCLQIEEGDTIEEAFGKVISALCGSDDGKEWDVVISGLDIIDSTEEQLDGRIGGKNKSPFNSYVTTDISWVEPVGLEVEFIANTFWIDGTNISKDAERITFLNDKDNYLRLNRNDSYNYSILSQTIGAIAPTNDKDYIYLAKIPVVDNIIGTLVEIIEKRPIDGTKIKENSILEEHISSELLETLYALTEGNIYIGNSSNQREELSMISEVEGGIKVLIGNDTEVSAIEIDNTTSDIDISEELSGLVSTIKDNVIDATHLKGLVSGVIADNFLIYVTKDGTEYKFTEIELIEGGVLTVADGVPYFAA